MFIVKIIGGISVRGGICLQWTCSTKLHHS